MGNKPTPGTTEAVIMDNYQLINTEDDKRFGEVAIYKNKKSEELVWIKEIPIEDEAAYDHYQEYLKTREYNDDLYIACNPNFIGGQAASSPNFCGQCGSGNKVIIIMEFFERDLEGEIMRRSMDNVKNRCFGLSQFWSF